MTDVPVPSYEIDPKIRLSEIDELIERSIGLQRAKEETFAQNDTNHITRAQDALQGSVMLANVMLLREQVRALNRLIALLGGSKKFD